LQHRNGSGSIIANFTYTYDLASRVSTKTDNGSTTTYSYDTTNQVTNDSATTYTYDLNGNRTMTGYATGTGNRMSNDGTWTYYYDDEGNLTKKTKGASAETWTYGYDHDNHLIWVEQRSSDGGTLLQRLDFKYDAFGDRIEKDVTVGSTTVNRYGYDGSNVWADLNGSNQLQMRRLYLDGIDSVFARISSAGTASWYLPDRLGSVRNIVDSGGALIDTIAYDGFGVVTSESATGNGDRYKFTGRELDSETGLQLNGLRYYDAKTGRWTSEDPIGFRGWDPNLYRYVGNQATNAVDPTGEYLVVDADAEQQYIDEFAKLGLKAFAIKLPVRGFLGFARDRSAIIVKDRDLLRQEVWDLRKEDYHSWRGSLLRAALEDWSWQVWGDKNLLLTDIKNGSSEITDAEAEAIGFYVSLHDERLKNLKRDTGASGDCAQLSPTTDSREHILLEGRRAEERRRRLLEKGHSYLLILSEEYILGLDPTKPSFDDTVAMLLPSAAAAEARFNQRADRYERLMWRRYDRGKTTRSRSEWVRLDVLDREKELEPAVANAWDLRHSVITARLREHLSQAVKQAELTPAQVRDILKNGRASRHWGTQIDTRFKELVQNDWLLEGEVAVSPRGVSAPDVIDLRAKRWWDVTSTRNEFAKKPAKYGTQYGQGTSLLYCEP